MDNRKAYNVWAGQYDTNNNKTRDVEATALRQALNDISFTSVLEIGCGTGKNSEWFVSKARQVVAVDFSEEMLGKAKAKIKADNIEFIKADITGEWTFTEKTFDLISCSLVLEHIQDLDFIFRQARKKITGEGYLYIGELHPFKQYSGSLARFDTANQRVELQCFTHHISEFIGAANKHGFIIHHLNEWFDNDDKNPIPRVLTLLFKAV